MDAMKKIRALGSGSPVTSLRKQAPCLSLKAFLLKSPSASKNGPFRQLNLPARNLTSRRQQSPVVMGPYKPFVQQPKQKDVTEDSHTLFDKGGVLSLTVEPRDEKNEDVTVEIAHHASPTEE